MTINVFNNGPLLYSNGIAGKAFKVLFLQSPFFFFFFFFNCFI